MNINRVKGAVENMIPLIPFSIHQEVCAVTLKIIFSTNNKDLFFSTNNKDLFNLRRTLHVSRQT